MATAGRDLRIYFEGDKSLKSGLRTFLSELYVRMRQMRRKFDVLEAKGTPILDYQNALRSHPDAWNILLLDSEGPLTLNLLTRNKLLGFDSESVFWMVQVMESWFIADKAALVRYYGQRFNSSSLPLNPQVESISKQDVIAGLKAATRNTQKGEYHKTRHAPEILAALDPSLVRKASPQCERLFTTILK